MEFGIFTFGDVTPDARGHYDVARRMREIVAEAETAERVGLEVFAVGEHHRPDFAISAPAVVLAAIAARTSRLRLSSAVNVLSSDDPVRVFQQFATLDLLSSGRAEIMVGRGSFTESFPLFGHDLADYDELFEEKLDLLLRIREDTRVTWSGRHRAALRDQPVHPRPLQDPLPVWVAVGGHPESAVRAGVLGLPMALAIIGGLPERFAPLADLFRRAAREAGIDPPPAFSVNSHGLIADTRAEAERIALGPFKATMDRIGRERGWPPMSAEDFAATTALRGANFIGSPDDIVEKILFQQRIFRHDRFLLQMTIGSIPHEHVLRSIELFGTVVVPAVRRALAAAEAPATA